MREGWSREEIPFMCVIVNTKKIDKKSIAGLLFLPSLRALYLSPSDCLSSYVHFRKAIHCVSLSPSLSLFCLVITNVFTSPKSSRAARGVERVVADKVLYIFQIESISLPPSKADKVFSSEGSIKATETPPPHPNGTAYHTVLVQTFFNN